MADALQTPPTKPRVLVIPQLCLDPVVFTQAVPSLSFEEVEKMTEEGSIGPCDTFTLKPDEKYNNVWLDSGTKGYVKFYRPLLRSDAVAPIIVVDLWSAPALFLRHVEVRTGN